MAKKNSNRIKLIAGLRAAATAIENRSGGLKFNDIYDIATMVFGTDVEEDNCGQMVIYTSLRDTKRGVRSM